MATTTDSTSQAPDPEERPVWAFVLVECLYIICYFAVMVAVHRTGILKNDYDAVIVHHKIHGQMIESQEKKFVEEQQMNLANAGP